MGWNLGHADFTSGEMVYSKPAVDYVTQNMCPPASLLADTATTRQDETVWDKTETLVDVSFLNDTPLSEDIKMQVVACIDNRVKSIRSTHDDELLEVGELTRNLKEEIKEKDEKIQGLYQKIADRVNSIPTRAELEYEGDKLELDNKVKQLEIDLSNMRIKMMQMEKDIKEKDL